MTDITDTLLNVSVFVFVGLMLWLYFKDTPDAPSQDFRAGVPEERK